jgi:hypothetical protein
VVEYEEFTVAAALEEGAAVFFVFAPVHAHCPRVHA